VFCPKCGKENPDTNQYCGKCGESLKIYTQRLSEKQTPSQNEKQPKKINEQQHNRSKNDNKIVEYIEYIGWGPFIIIIFGLLTSWIPLGIILLIIGVAWAIFKHINLGDIEWNVRVTDNKALKEDEEDEDDEFEDEDDEHDDDFTGTGYCIRCGEMIGENPYKPLCEDCYSIWAQYSNRYYPENFCHICGKESDQSYSKPICYSCYKKYFK
jgi:hypothetical protein